MPIDQISWARLLGLAAHAAEKLEHTTDSLETLADRDEAIAEVVDGVAFLKYLDRIVFCCASCGYWKRQRENATPGAATCKCQECL